MNLKSYLRGIGIGMVVAAAVLHFTFSYAAKSEMTDEEIKQRALELGMIENTVLKPGESGESAGSTENPPSSVSDDSVSSSSVSDNVSVSLNNADENNDGNSVENDENQLPQYGNDDIMNDVTDDDFGEESVEFVTVTVVSGDSSYSVAKKVYEAGLVESVATFDQFLCYNGYDKIITVGTHRIPVDASEQEIAIELTK